MIWLEISLEDYINHPKKGGGRCRKMVFWKPTEFPHVQTSASAGLSGNRTLHLLNVWMFGSKNQVISWRTKTNSLWHFFEVFLITFSCCRSMIFVKSCRVDLDTFDSTDSVSLLVGANHPYLLQNLCSNHLVGKMVSNCSRLLITKHQPAKVFVGLHTVDTSETQLSNSFIKMTWIDSHNDWVSLGEPWNDDHGPVSRCPLQQPRTPRLGWRGWWYPEKLTAWTETCSLLKEDIHLQTIFFLGGFHVDFSFGVQRHY